MLQELVYQMPIVRDMAELRQTLMSTWAGFQQSVVDEPVDQWQET